MWISALERKPIRTVNHKENVVGDQMTVNPDDPDVKAEAIKKLIRTHA
jgi:hypothetical protein